MDDFKASWSNDELKAYLFLYCAYSNYDLANEEKDMIDNKLDADTVKKMEKEFSADNDYQKVQKILTNAKGLNYSKNEIESLIDEMQEIFLADGKFDSIEKNCFRELKRLLD
jgi:Fe-S cluster biosynthesis and repair protein YggX